MQKEQANYRIDTAAKRKAYKVLGEIGIKPTDAVNMLMHNIAMFGKLPFQPSIPSYETSEITKPKIIKTEKTLENNNDNIELTNHDIIDNMFCKTRYIVKNEEA